MSHILFCIYDRQYAAQVIPYMEEAGHEVTFVKSVDDAFSRLSESPKTYDLVFSYAILIGGYSFDLSKRCAEYPPTANIPFLHLGSVPNEHESYVAWEAQVVKYEFDENGRDAYVGAFMWQKEYILPAIRAVLDKQKPEDA